MYYGPGGTFLEKKVEYPSLRVSPKVNCNQFTFHTITLSSAGACEVSILTWQQQGGKCASFFFPEIREKANFSSRLGNQSPFFQFFSEKKKKIRCY